MADDVKQVLIHTDKNGAKWYAPVSPAVERIWVDNRLVYDRDRPAKQ